METNMPLTQSERKYLANRNRGGRNNSKGNNYENHFALFKIVEHANSFMKRSAEAIIRTQVDEAFVDDLQISTKDCEEYFQIKNTQSLSWGNGKMGSLAYDFKRQSEIGSSWGARVNLGLVNSSEELCKRLSSKKPKTLTTTEVIYFPHAETIPLLIGASPAFKDELVALCAISNPTADKLEALATYLLGIWCGYGSGQLLTAIIEKAQQIPISFVRSQIHFVYELNASVRAILDSVPNFSYQIENRYFQWSFGGTDSGTITELVGSEAFEKIMDRIAVENPTNFTELEPLII